MNNLSSCFILFATLSLVAGMTSGVYAEDTGTASSVRIGAYEAELTGASGVLTSLQARDYDGFDYLPKDRYEQRKDPGFYHIGDIFFDLRLAGAGQWRRFTSKHNRSKASEVSSEDITAIHTVDLTKTLGENSPLEVVRVWSQDGDDLLLSFHIRNKTSQQVEIGTLGIPMVFNNIISGRELKETHEKCVFVDPYIGQDAGYLQVTRLIGTGPALVVMPESRTPLEGYQVLDEPMHRVQTFEGHFAWLVHTKAIASTNWKNTNPWNRPTSVTLQPEESRTYVLRFALSNSIREIEDTLLKHQRPVATGVPGYILPNDLEGRLFLRHTEVVKSITIEPADAMDIMPVDTPTRGVQAYAVHSRGWGRARMEITYGNGDLQTVHYYLTKPATEVVRDYANFLLTEQWYEDDGDPFGRSPSVISYDRETNKKVLQEKRAWIAGLSDEGGAGSWLGAGMALYASPNPKQIAQYERFINEVLWGGIQNDSGDKQYGIRKSMFYYDVSSKPEGYYDPSIDWSTWASWNKKAAGDLGRSYNYPHAAAVYWGMYRTARYNTDYKSSRDWQWYLTQAYKTGIAMVQHAPHYAVHGQMEGTVFVRIMEDLEREGWVEQARQYEAVMKKRADVWSREEFPFGSEMAWDSTGQEEVYAWCKYFGYHNKAEVSLNSILGYMPSVPHWGYHGSARRYWDFWYAGKHSRLERQLHHYGSGLNAIPLLDAYRRNPDDYYLLQVGYAGMMGNLTNIDQDGFGSAAFHSFPDSLSWDPYSGDFGCGFTGHVLNAATYLLNHPQFGWISYGGNIELVDQIVVLKPLDTMRKRVFIAPISLWIELKSGQFDRVIYDPSEETVTIDLIAEQKMTDTAYMFWSDLSGKKTYAAEGDFALDKGGLVVPLDGSERGIVLRGVED